MILVARSVVQPHLMAHTISNCMTVGTIALLIYFVLVGIGFAYMIRKDFFDHD